MNDDEPKKMNRAKKVRRLQVMWHMRQCDIGRMMRRSRSAASRRLSGQVEFSDADLRGIARFYGIDWRWFDEIDEDE